jgi:hypothetical protein
VYTDDSDLVAVLLHLGYYASNNTASNPLVARFYAQVSMTQQLLQQHATAAAFDSSSSSSRWIDHWKQLHRCDNASIRFCKAEQQHV